MTILEPAVAGRDLVPVGDWHPTRYTPSLTGTEDFRTDGDRLIAAAGAYWSSPEVETFTLDPWQAWLIRHALERYPDDWPDPARRGRFRYRQIVISMGRQNGKSLLAALFGFYGLTMHTRGPRVLGVARSVRQANIVYERVRYAVRKSPVLTKRLKQTGTRGISHRDGSGVYETQPASEDALQGWPISLALFDELHIAPADMWGAIVNGQRSRDNALLVGITTAGDDDSELLKRLYVQGDEAIADPAERERFGFFCWEAPEDELTEPNVIAANPAVACGRIDLDTVMTDAAALPRADQIRYTLNRFTSSTATALPVERWHDAGRGGIPDERQDAPVVFALDRAESWAYAAITATVKLGDTLHTEVVASLVKPTPEQLVDVCVRLREAAGVCAYAMDGVMLSMVGKDLRDRGCDVWILTANETAQAAALTYAAITRGRVSHPGDALVSTQLPRAKRKNTGDAWRLSRALSSVEIDAVTATTYGLYVADIARPPELQLF